MLCAFFRFSPPPVTHPHTRTHHNALNHMPTPLSHPTHTQTHNSQNHNPRNPGSNAGAGACSSCGPGRYSNTTAAAACAPCDAGTWSNATGLATACTNPCAAGYSCPAGSSSPSPCVAGRYGVSCSGVCPTGSYCPTGTALPVPCPGGRYGGTTGLTSSSCTGVCAAGVVCPVGTSVPTPCGNASVYCGTGSAVSVAVPQGSYSTPEAADATQRTGVSVCGPGQYCVAGVRSPCAEGTFSSVPARTTPCDALCPPGMQQPVFIT